MGTQNILAMKHLPANTNNPASQKTVATVPMEHSQAKLKTFIRNIATKIYTYDSAHYQQQLKEITPSFTTAGWKKFYSALKASGNLTEISQKNISVEAKALDEPKIEASVHQTWRSSIPLEAVYQSGEFTRKQVLQVYMDVILTSNNTYKVSFLTVNLRESNNTTNVATICPNGNCATQV